MKEYKSHCYKGVYYVIYADDENNIYLQICYIYNFPIYSFVKKSKILSANGELVDDKELKNKKGRKKAFRWFEKKAKQIIDLYHEHKNDKPKSDEELTEMLRKELVKGERKYE